ncbi:phage integrase family protein [Cupriavidus basilensis]|uniref:phage integrase family protein n=1 Tax=Cupriavidus basilensis TaxID=68895 RepID=UPI00157A50D6|nr:phage integrase family protein [Cupriavidus basilensis]NUA30262.1 integrase [Cupriavidus basilensis]
MPSDPLEFDPLLASQETAAPLASLPVVTRPRLERGHFAYLRATQQGVPPRVAWPRYLGHLGDADDATRVHRMTGWIRGELCAAAARGGNFARARLLRLELAPLCAALPSLESFADGAGLAGFSEAEQQDAYEAAFGTALAQQRRRTALLRRQLLAVHTLEASMAQPVGLDDGCEAWLTDAIAARLAAHGQRTLAELHARVRGDALWWRGIPGIGAGKAAAIRHFLVAHGATLGALPDGETLGSAKAEHPATQARQQREPNIPPEPSPLMPLERLVVPPGLDGRDGRFRAPRTLCLLEADDDRAAVLAWLAAKTPDGGGEPTGPDGRRLSHTRLSYRREAERFLLWCVLERQRALSSITPEDVVAFKAFLQAPPASWCGPRNVPRWHVAWHPLEGALSARSVAFALSVLGNLFAFLVAQNYLVGNPFRAVRPPVRIPRGPDPGRSLGAELWQHVADALDALPPSLASERLAVTLHLAHDAGLRLSELVGARTHDLERVTLRQADGTPITGWLLRVVGKGQKVRLVPVPDVWVERLGRYLVARGLLADPRRAPDVPLLGGVRGAAAVDAGVTGSAVHGQLKRFFAACAAQLERTDPVLAERLRRASGHWLRHAHINDALDGGVPAEIVQQNVGHASLDTTTVYIRTEDARRLALMRRWWETAG